MRDDCPREHLRRHRSERDAAQGARKRPATVHPRISARVLASLALFCSAFASHTVSTCRHNAPQEVAADLDAAGASEPILTTVVSVWRAESPAYLKQLRSRQLGAPDCLHGVNWRIHVPMVRRGLETHNSARPALVVEKPRETRRPPQQSAQLACASPLSPRHPPRSQAGSGMDKDAPAELLGVLDLALGPPKVPGQVREEGGTSCSATAFRNRLFWRRVAAFPAPEHCLPPRAGGAASRTLAG